MENEVCNLSLLFESDAEPNIGQHVEDSASITDNLSKVPERQRAAPLLAPDAYYMETGNGDSRSSHLDNRSEASRPDEIETAELMHHVMMNDIAKQLESAPSDEFHDEEN